MKLPRTWPVCIIDDQPTEYERLFKVLTKLGVGYVHVKGDLPSQLPSRPYGALRLVFLDMHLGGDSLSANTASQTAKVFSKVVSVDSAPILVVVWSKYTSEIDAFRSELYRSKPDYCGRLVFVSIDKPSDASKIAARKLRKDIIAVLAPLVAIRLLWGWESLAHLAAINASTELSMLAYQRSGPTDALNSVDERSRILGGIKGVLEGLILAEAGKAASPKAAPADLLHALGAIHVDRIESTKEVRLMKDASGILGTAPVASSAKERAAMNSMLVVGSAETEGHVLKPGTIYELSSPRGVATKLGFTIDELLSQFCTNPVSSNAASFATWKSECKAILIEISPACDYAQGARRLARLVAGILVPNGRSQDAKYKSECKKDGSIFSLVRFNLINRRTGVSVSMLPILSSRYCLTLPLKKAPKFMKAIGRLRDPALTDLRNWCGAEGSRVGFLYA